MSDFEPPSDPVIIKQLMESTEDQEMEEGESEGKTEEEGEDSDQERILDPNVTPLKAPRTQSSSSSGHEEEGHKDMEFEPFDAP